MESGLQGSSSGSEPAVATTRPPTLQEGWLVDWETVDKDNIQPVGAGYGAGVQVGVEGIPEADTSTNHYFAAGQDGLNGQGDQVIRSQGSNCGGESHLRRLLLDTVSGPKERRKAKASNQSQVTQQICLSQDGEIAHSEDLLQEGDWLTQLDLKDAYFTISVARDHRKYLSFKWRSQPFQFQCLPFSLS